MKRRVSLGVNIDHIATLRQARGTVYPDPIEAAFIAERAGADSITLHLREDRRHIQERDLDVLLQTSQTKINLEMAVTEEMLAIACAARPCDVCLVPERREELTTEGGLDVAGQTGEIAAACARLAAAGIRVSLFIDPEPEQIDAALAAGAPVVELHTGRYAEAETGQVDDEWQRLRRAAERADAAGLIVNAGHGLNYHNVERIVELPQLRELNIGHAIIARAVLVGLESAVRDMKALLADV